MTVNKGKLAIYDLVFDERSGYWQVFDRLDKGNVITFNKSLDFCVNNMLLMGLIDEKDILSMATTAERVIN